MTDSSPAPQIENLGGLGIMIGGSAGSLQTMISLFRSVDTHGKYVGGTTIDPP